MTLADAVTQIQSLRTQIDILEAKIQAMPQDKPHSFADLRGMLRGLTTTDEEIRASRYMGIKPESLE